MKYIIGYTSYEYVINGIRIPKKAASRTEQPGPLGVTAVSEEQLELLNKNKLFQRLLAAKSIKVLDTRPSWAVTSTEKISELQEENNRLRAELKARK
jgi:hypothetical protein